MNKIMKFFTVLFFVTIVGFVNAQTLKFGHIDLNALIQIMPERAAAESELSNFQKDMEDVLSEMQQNYQAKLKELEQLSQDVSQIKRDVKIDELQNIQQRIQNYRITAQEQIQEKYEELLKPIYDKAMEAIGEVAKERDLIYVFNVSSNVLLYKSNQSIDILPYVKQKLNID
jgi:outer membrane protein